MDLYRLGGIAEGFEIGLLDYLSRAESGIIIVEWAEKILSLLPQDYLRVDFQVLSTRKRQIALSGAGVKFSDLLKELGNK